MKDDYIPYGKEWLNEMMNFPKKSLIELWLKPNLIRCEDMHEKIKIIEDKNKELITDIERLKREISSLIFPFSTKWPRGT